MMSSSEIQRITLSTTKIVSPNGSVDLEDWEENDDAEDEKNEEVDEASTLEVTTPISAANSDLAVNQLKGEKMNESDDRLTPILVSGITNGVDSSPTYKLGNETITSSIGDITLDSIKDHLNSTVTTLCSSTTEEIVGRLSVLSTSTNNQTTMINPKEILDIKTLKEVAGETNETHQNSVIVKSVITTISHGTGTAATNGEGEKTTSTVITRKESQF